MSSSAAGTVCGRIACKRIDHRYHAPTSPISRNGATEIGRSRACSKSVRKKIPRSPAKTSGPTIAAAAVTSPFAKYSFNTSMKCDGLVKRTIATAPSAARGATAAAIAIASSRRNGSIRSPVVPVSPVVPCPGSPVGATAAATATASATDVFCASAN